MKNNAQHINQTSGDFDYYTPVEIVEVARKVMRWIDLDPASDIKANEIVKANSIYTADDNSLSI